MKHVVLYVPGLGDKRKSLLWVQRQLLRGWRVFGIRTELFIVGWSSNADTFDDRLSRLQERIDELKDQGYLVALVGASAGASTVLSAFSLKKDSVTHMVAICGQLRGVDYVPEPALALQPRFRESLEVMEQHRGNLAASDLRRILTLRPRVDVVVQPEEATVKGAINVRMPVFGHLLGIGFAIVFEGHRIARFIRH